MSVGVRPSLVQSVSNSAAAPAPGWRSTTRRPRRSEKRLTVPLASGDSSSPRARLAQRFPAEVEASEQRLTALLADALRDAAVAGVLRSDPEHDVETIYTLAMGWVQRRLAQPEPASRAEAEHVIAFALRGLGAQ